MQSINEDIEVIRAASLPGVPHGFLGRSGGVSQGIYAGLNIALGSKDAREHVLENRRRAVAAVMPGAVLARVYQIHSADVVTAIAGGSYDAGSNPFDQNNPPKADAMVTNTRGVLLGISTADCVPVLFADMQAGVVGAAHSGWKGAITGVNEATLAAMEALGADRSRILCAIGPCIAQKSYEVDDAFFARFAKDDPANERFFSESNVNSKAKGDLRHHQFDIEGYVASQLAASGITRTECLGQDTYSQPDRFFSYRRTCHAGERDYGTQISLIGLSQ